jgi:hypothetical protein
MAGSYTGSSEIVLISWTRFSATLLGYSVQSRAVEVTNLYATSWLKNPDLYVWTERP